MTPEETIKILKNIPDSVMDSLSATEFEALKMAVKALERQVPTKPLKCVDKYTEWTYELACPSCEALVGRGNERRRRITKENISDICWKCGQALDFEKTEGK